MSNCVLIVGESGSGKSTALRTLDPASTYLINVSGQPLPFKRSMKLYKAGKGGNMYCTDNAKTISDLLRRISAERPEIKTVVIDDWQYVMANEFMRRSMEKGYDKFTDIAKNAWDTINAANNMRDGIDVFILTHSEKNVDGTVKCKTIGKMIDDKIVLEGMFTIVLHALVSDGNYKFLTQNTGQHIAKSPMGMFDELYIANDLLQIKVKMSEYYCDEDEVEDVVPTEEAKKEEKGAPIDQ